ncbi:MAG TPA: oxidoreductase [Firmicutes bacterium]|jgi:UDP-N-acetyl-2-amino-2-deoxyglucuronate dehydrogenase|nr:oxidoreductase [Bacillota bacterium]
MSTFRFGLIGCGRIAPNHARNIKELEQSELKAVCDLAPEKAEKYSRTYGGEVYTDYRKVLDRPDIDIISIATSSGCHAEIGIAAAEAGKHVIVEKPMALSLHDADRLIAACAQSHVYLGVCHQNRYNQVVQKLRQALETGRFGKLTHATAVIRWYRDQHYFEQDSWHGTWAQDGGVLMNQSIHNIDLLQWMMGQVTGIYGKITTRQRQIEVEDLGLGMLTFKSGAQGMIEASSTVYPRNLEETLNIFGETGTVILGGPSINKIEAWRFADGLDNEVEVLTSCGETPPNIYGFGHRTFYERFMKAIESGTEFDIPGTEGRKALEIILGIYHSSMSGQPVELPLKEKAFPLPELMKGYKG